LFKCVCFQADQAFKPFSIKIKLTVLHCFSQ
jgi:hypothetical protein